MWVLGSNRMFSSGLGQAEKNSANHLVAQQLPDALLVFYGLFDILVIVNDFSETF